MYRWELPLSWKKRLKEFHYSAFEIEKLITVIRTCLSQTTFSFQGHFYKESEGLAIALPFHLFSQRYLCTTLKTLSLKKISFLFWTRYVNATFTLINTFLHIVDHILQTLNWSENYILFMYEIENSGALPFLNALVSRGNEGFSTSVYRKIFAVSLPQHARSCHPSSQKMAAFYTFVKPALNNCSDHFSFNNEI